jgi:EAL domain-containing protein (putative c-di-GMP-specific phosphodiesterase class I)
MVKLARALNLDVIAEGVETPVQMERLVVCGCHEFQGHLIGRPVPPEAIVSAIDVGADPAEAEPEALPRRAISARV